MANEMNLELRTFENRLALRVKEEHGSRCPCCGHPMVRPRRDTAVAKRRRDRQTVAHNHPVSFGGDVTIWVYACNGCNGDQKGLTFRAWSLRLARSEDPRAAAVAALADVVEEFIKEKAREHFRPVSAVGA